MAKFIQVEVDEAGAVHPLDPDEKLPAGRATLIWQEAAADMTSWEMSKVAFAEDWLRPEEDEAWAHFQQEK